MANSLILSIKVVLISIGAISLAMVAKASIPLIYHELPAIWSVLIAWLKPPYLYFVINAIILIIFATSRSSNHKEYSSSDEQLQPLITARTPPQSDLIAITQSELHSVQSEVKVFEVKPVVVDEPQVFEVKPVLVNGSVVVMNHEDEDHDDPDESEAIVIPKSVVSPLPEIESKNELLLIPATEKPLVSSRFGNRKPAVKMSPEGT